MRKKTSRGGAILAAACALPGLAVAEAPPGGAVGFKYLYYRDWQPDLDRIEVSAPSIFALVPIGANWSLDFSAVSDTISGATPRYHTSVSGASPMSDTRYAGDVKVTRYFRRAAVGLGYAYSTENDYTSNAVSLDARLATEDNNTTVALGAGFVDDRIDSTGGAVVGEKKRTSSYMAGVTQVLSPSDIAKLNVTYARGRGFFSDPYKLLDMRPRARNQTAALIQWNHHFGSLDGTLRTTYRYYRDSFLVKAHTAGLEYEQALPAGLAVTPSLRYHSQSAAFFYYDPVYDPVLGEPIPIGFDPSNPPQYLSADHRLSAFGAVTVGVKAVWKFARVWSVDFRYDRYQQRGEWRIGGAGSPGLATFNAEFYQAGVTFRF
jgi:hypothetical protein